jgi:hypothetical protein
MVADKELEKSDKLAWTKARISLFVKRHNDAKEKYDK